MEFDQGKIKIKIFEPGNVKQKYSESINYYQLDDYLPKYGQNQEVFNRVYISFIQKYQLGQDPKLGV